MKNKIWVLILVAGIVLAITACDVDVKSGPANCVDKGGKGHLGIGEKANDDCGGVGCTGLKSYGNVAGRKIYRNGPTNDTNFTDGKIQTFANTIVPAYDATENVGNIPLLTWVEILKDGKHSYDAGALKFFIDGEPIQAWLNNQAKPKLHAAPYDHLGVDENKRADCGNDCTYKDYNNYEPRDLVPGAPESGQFVLNKPIYRYGKEENYTNDELTETTEKIIEAFRNSAVSYIGGNEYNELMAAIDTLCVAKSVGTGNDAYVWLPDRKLFGADPALSQAATTNRLKRVISTTNPLDETAPKFDIIVQLMPTATGNVRLANSKKKTEQFPAVAGGADKDPKANRVRRLEYSCT